MTAQTTHSITEQIIDLTVDQVNCPREQVVPEAEFVADLGFDSLDVAEFVINIEDTFSIEVPVDDAEQIKTVQQAISQVEQALNK